MKLKPDYFMKLVGVLVADYKMQLAHSRRRLEKIEKEHAFELQNGKKIEDRIAELKLCLK